MRQVTIKGELRHQTGKGAARRMRASHRVPAVVYGRGEETTIISLDEREFEKAMQAGLGGGTLIKLVLTNDADTEGPGKIEKTAILKEVQSDVVRGNVIHVDLQAISLDEAITTKVPVVLVELVVLTNPKDEAFVASEAGQTSLADALAAGVVAAVKS